MSNNGCYSVLHFAAYNGHSDVLLILVEELGVSDVEIKDARGLSPLHIAASRGHVEAVRVLVRDLGADVNAPDAGPQRWSPLRYAFEGNHFEVAHVLLKELGADGENGCALGLTPDEVDTLVGSGLCEGKGAPFRNSSASTSGLPSDEEEGKSSSEGFLACEKDDEGVLSPSSVKRRAHRAICFAAQSGDVALARLLVKKFGADVNGNSCGKTPLYFAAAGGHAEMLRALVREFSADPLAKSANGETNLHCAAMWDHCDAARILVREMGADVGAKDKNGSTPLHIAVSFYDAIVCLVGTKVFGNSVMINVLVKELGADVHARDEKGRTPLHVAASCCESEALQLLNILTELGADVNAGDGTGGTPLHTAVEVGCWKFARALVREHGADVNVKDEGGRTPLHLAEESGQHETARVLVKELGARVLESSVDSQGSP